MYRQLRRQGFKAQKCYEIISQKLEGELSPSSVKKVIYFPSKKKAQIVQIPVNTQ